jgi:hypothetical protein
VTVVGVPADNPAVDSHTGDYGAASFALSGRDTSGLATSPVGRPSAWTIAVESMNWAYLGLTKSALAGGQRAAPQATKKRRRERQVCIRMNDRK